MKALIFTVILFSLLLALIVFNYIYINRVSSELASKVSAISPDVREVDELKLLWESKKSFIVLSSGMTKIDNIYNLLDTLYICAEFRDTAEFERTRALTVNAFEDLSEFESFSFEDIF